MTFADWRDDDRDKIESLTSKLHVAWRATQLLAKHEFCVEDSFGVQKCPECGGPDPQQQLTDAAGPRGHRPDCELARVVLASKEIKW